MFFFSSEYSFNVLNDIFRDKAALINIANFKKPTKSSTEHYNSKKRINHSTKCFVKCFYFSSQIYLKASFISPKGFYTKNLNTAHTLIEIKQNLMH